ncbi:MAG: class I SAM-dependent methyltransferase [Firmicutes bacterium]|nr:class I SAM-dependent methyltransferase [Bacillota bacterium]
MKETLKQELWDIWNAKTGSLSKNREESINGISGQIYWEYDYIIDNLPPFSNDGSYTFAVIGCNGGRMLSDLLRRHCRCINIDPLLDPSMEDDIKADLDEKLAEKLNDLETRAVICFSVVEQAENRKRLMQNLDLIEAPLILTFQFGNEPPAFEKQLTNKSLYEMSSVIKNHYVSRFEKCPILEENSKGKRWPVGLLLLPA